MRGGAGDQETPSGTEAQEKVGQVPKFPKSKVELDERALSLPVEVRAWPPAPEAPLIASATAHSTQGGDGTQSTSPPFTHNELENAEARILFILADKLVESEKDEADLDKADFEHGEGRINSVKKFLIKKGARVVQQYGISTPKALSFKIWKLPKMGYFRIDYNTDGWPSESSPYPVSKPLQRWPTSPRTFFRHPGTDGEVRLLGPHGPAPAVPGAGAEGGDVAALLGADEDRRAAEDDNAEQR